MPGARPLPAASNFVADGWSGARRRTDEDDRLLDGRRRSARVVAFRFWRDTGSIKSQFRHYK
jgi:hypothetical protein